jgi:hypothetical protein
MLLELLAVKVAKYAHRVLSKILPVEPFACPVHLEVLRLVKEWLNAYLVVLVDLLPL